MDSYIDNIAFIFEAQRKKYIDPLLLKKSGLTNILRRSQFC